MANIPIDSNGRPAIGCASNTDGKTIIAAQADPSTHELLVDDNSTGTDHGNNGGQAMIDENGNAVWLAQSSANDGTFVEVYINSSKQILIKSN